MAWIAPWLAAFAGCQQELGPVRGPVADVAGRVTVGGRPLVRGWIEFIPIQGAVGPLRTAEVAPDGKFEVKGLSVGEVTLRVVGARPDTPDSRFLGQQFAIRRQIPPDGTAQMNIDLTAEAIRARAEALP